MLDIGPQIGFCNNAAWKCFSLTQAHTLASESSQQKCEDILYRKKNWTSEIQSLPEGFTAHVWPEIWIFQDLAASTTSYAPEVGLTLIVSFRFQISLES